MPSWVTHVGPPGPHSYASLSALDHSTPAPLPSPAALPVCIYSNCHLAATSAAGLAPVLGEDRAGQV